VTLKILHTSKIIVIFDINWALKFYEETLQNQFRNTTVLLVLLSKGTVLKSLGQKAILDISDTEVTGYEMNGRDSIPGRGINFSILQSSPRPDRLWGPPSFLFSGYQRLFSGGKAVGASRCLLTSI
jgi:hypothetical protein